MNRVFSSNFAVHIEDLIQQKHRLGYPYDESERILYNFDQFCLQFFPLERTLTQQLGLTWAIRRESESVNTFRNRMMPVRELARHLNRLGIEAYPYISQESMGSIILTAKLTAGTKILEVSR